MIQFTQERIDPNEVFQRISRKSSGSVVSHVGIVREKTGDKITEYMEFEIRDGAEKELAGIADDIKEKWGLEDIIIVHRTGRLEVGDVVAVVVVSAGHRPEAFKACHEGVDRFKSMENIKATDKTKDSPD